MKFGAHVSVSGGLIKALERALERDCETMQIFSQGPRNWTIHHVEEEEAHKFRRRIGEEGIFPVVLHAPYLLNLSSPYFPLRFKSAWSLIEGAVKGEEIGAHYIVFHPGSSKGASKKLGLRRLIEALEYVLEKTERILFLLENTAPAGSAVASFFTEISLVIKSVSSERLGVCFDTAHAYAAGYDLASPEGFNDTMNMIEKNLGFERIKLIHANDSHYPLASGKDRHAHIGEGFIGLEGFKMLLNFPPFENLPVILETPRMDLKDDVRNLNTLKSLKSEVSLKVNRVPTGGL
jgi:deoxyribonuclease-4